MASFTDLRVGLKPFGLSDAVLELARTVVMHHIIAVNRFFTPFGRLFSAKGHRGNAVPALDISFLVVNHVHILSLGNSRQFILQLLQDAHFSASRND
jgi:hypothetical protein